MTHCYVVMMTVDSDREHEREFPTVEMAQGFVRGFDEGLINYVELYVQNSQVDAVEHHEFSIISGYSEILEYGR